MNLDKLNGFIAGLILAMFITLVNEGQATSITILDSFSTQPFPGTSIQSIDPEGLTFFDGHIWIIDDLTSTLYKYNREKQVLTQFSTGYYNPDFVFSDSLFPGEVDTFTIPGLTPLDPFVAWIQNELTVGPQSDTVLGTFDSFGGITGIDDDSSPVGNGLASALTGAVNPDGTIRLSVSGYGDFDFDGLFDGLSTSHSESGEYELFVKLGLVSDFTFAVDPEGLAYDGNHLWIAGGGAPTLDRIDPLTGGLLSRFDLTATTSGVITEAEGLAWDGTSIWVSADESLYQVNPLDGSLLSSFSYFHTDIKGLAWNGSHLLLGDSNRDEILFVDSLSGTIVDTWAGLPGGPDGLAYDGEYIWLSDDDAEMVYQIAVVPEPGSFLLLLVSILGAIGFGWRRKQRV